MKDIDKIFEEEWDEEEYSFDRIIPSGEYISFYYRFKNMKVVVNPDCDYYKILKKGFGSNIFDEIGKIIEISKFFYFGAAKVNPCLIVKLNEKILHFKPEELLLVE